MKVKLFGCDDSTKEFEIGDLKAIDEAVIEIYGGVEALTVCYMDGTYERYTAGTEDDIYEARIWIWYLAFSRVRSINMFEDKEWVGRESPLSFLDHRIDEAMHVIEGGRANEG